MSPRQAFRVVKPLLDTAPILPSAAHITRADLDRPSCRCCYRPLKADTPYCPHCEMTGAALRHLRNRARA